MALFIPTLVLYVMAAFLIRAPRSLYWAKGSLKLDWGKAMVPWHRDGLLFGADGLLSSVSIWFVTMAFPEMRGLFLMVGAAYLLLVLCKVIAGKDMERVHSGLVYELTNSRIMASFLTAIITFGLPDTLTLVTLGLIMTAFLLAVCLFTALFPIKRKSLQNTL